MESDHAAEISFCNQCEKRFCTKTILIIHLETEHVAEFMDVINMYQIICKRKYLVISINLFLNKICMI